MPDQPPSPPPSSAATPPASSTPPLAARALERLRKLADGNGIAPESIRILEADEKVYEIDGTMRLEPVADTRGKRYPGVARGRKGLVTLPSVADLRAEVERRTKDFREGTGWIPEAVALLKAQPFEGWGLDDVAVPLANHSAVLAATEPCPACQGRKMLTCTQCQGNGVVVCTQCQGQRQELCYNCLGRGTNPLQQDQPCIVCEGRRYVPCRFCQSQGHLVCPTCQGRRGTTCSACNGAGGITEEVALECVARTHFKLHTGAWPSGILRGLDRLGIDKLGQGYADISTVPLPDEERDEGQAPAAGFPDAPPGHEFSGVTEDKAARHKPPKPEVRYRALLPYADLRMDFNGKKAIVGAFGKRGALIGVPPFLDSALAPDREKLNEAARGRAELEPAVKAPLMRTALALVIAGKDDPRELRRNFPLGLSADAAQEIASNMRLALNRFTRRARAGIASACGMVAAGLFAGYFMTPLHARLAENFAWPAAALVDLSPLALALAGSWFALSAAIRMVLQRSFPSLKIPLRQKTGKTGISMQAGIALCYLIALFLAPVRPGWLGVLLSPV